MILLAKNWSTNFYFVRRSGTHWVWASFFPVAIEFYMKGPNVCRGKCWVTINRESPEEVCQIRDAREKIIDIDPWPLKRAREPGFYVAWSGDVAQSDTINYEKQLGVFLKLPQIKRALKVTKTPLSLGYPNPIFDKDNTRVSFLNNKECQGKKGRCTASFNTKSPQEDYWIKDGDGGLLIKKKCLPDDFWPQTKFAPHPDYYYITFSSERDRIDTDGETVVTAFLRLTKIVNALGLHNFVGSQLIGHINPLLEGIDIYFSIIGPVVCKGRCIARIDREKYQANFWIKDAEGTIVETSKGRGS
ncbi:hypothetical protein J3R30DRAFT_134867 [Lentinula aciculospora]|uniref:Uncharacterized protein n=1 Tax=Lentinula aciculospora TaxID=153920 RepID=A0A9W9DYZ0_9AGAR|nr:hypothetical protein J3R30DRAFT_134867 [Lentinula aciculospora]